MESPSFFSRIQALGRINTVLSEPFLKAKRPINEIDRKLVKGFFNRMLNEYKYLGYPEPSSDKFSPRDEFKSQALSGSRAFGGTFTSGTIME